MKVKADVTIEISERDLGKMSEDIAEDMIGTLMYEVKKAIRESEAWRELKMTIYHACLEQLREEVAKDFIDKIKGG